VSKFNIPLVAIALCSTRNCRCIAGNDAWIYWGTCKLPIAYHQIL